MSTNNRNSQNRRNNQYSRGRGRGRGRGNRYNKRGKYTSKKRYVKPVEKCPFIVGTTEWTNWKKERAPTRTLYGCNNKVLFVFTSKYNK